MPKMYAGAQISKGARSVVGRARYIEKIAEFRSRNRQAIFLVRGEIHVEAYLDRFDPWWQETIARSCLGMPVRTNASIQLVQGPPVMSPMLKVLQEVQCDYPIKL